MFIAKGLLCKRLNGSTKKKSNDQLQIISKQNETYCRYEGSKKSFHPCTRFCIVSTIIQVCPSVNEKEVPTVLDDAPRLYFVYVIIYHLTYQNKFRLRKWRSSNGLNFPKNINDFKFLFIKHFDRVWNDGTIIIMCYASTQIPCSVENHSKQWSKSKTNISVSTITSTTTTTTPQRFSKKWITTPFANDSHPVGEHRPRGFVDTPRRF